MKVGSLVVVHSWRRRRFVGRCIAIRRRGKASTFTVRGKGIDYTLSYNSPMLLAIEVRRPMKGSSRAKLY